MTVDNVIAELQELLLRAVLLGHSLPGVPGPVQLPDLDFVLREPVIYIVEQNVAGPLSVAGLAQPLEIVAEEKIKERALRHGDTAYLQFLAPETKNGSVGLSLVAKMAARDSNRQPLGLSGVHVVFVRKEAGWEVVEDPIYSAF